jgi:siroheme decarboxylase
MKPERKFILALSRPLGIIKKPFAPAAKRLGLKESALLELVKQYKEKGLIRRLGLILAHRNIGFKSNVLVAWKVEGKDLGHAVDIFKNSGRVSHCYQRKTSGAWPYNIYTMIHATSRQDCRRIIRMLCRKSGLNDYRELFTLKELKKTKADIWSLIR